MSSNVSCNTDLMPNNAKYLTPADIRSINIALVLFPQPRFSETVSSCNEERKLISQGVDLDSEILKVSHHGSKTSSSQEFIKIVKKNVYFLLRPIPIFC